MHLWTTLKPRSVSLPPGFARWFARWFGAPSCHHACGGEDKRRAAHIRARAEGRRQSRTIRRVTFRTRRGTALKSEDPSQDVESARLPLKSVRRGRSACAKAPKSEYVQGRSAKSVRQGRSAQVGTSRTFPHALRRPKSVRRRTFRMRGVAKVGTSKDVSACATAPKVGTSKDVSARAEARALGRSSRTIRLRTFPHARSRTSRTLSPHALRRPSRTIRRRTFRTR